MNDRLHFVNPDTCRGDGICAAVCPEQILELVNGKAATVRERAPRCILCGQCVAACPTQSLRMPELPEETFGELKKLPFGYDEFLAFLRRRRSVRVFKPDPVSEQMRERILEAASTAPIGFPPHSTEVVVIDRREELDFLLRELVKDYTWMVNGFSNPLFRGMIRLTKGAEIFRAFQNHALEIAKRNNELYLRDGTDRYTYHAPMLMLFHGSRWAMSYEENAHLVCHHAMLAAVSLGLGTTILGIVPPIVDQSKVLRSRYGIPRENKVVTSLILGHPKYKYRRAIRRSLAGVRVV
ncbi:MAG: nitroreductase family protein [Polyangiaceae bacterium]